MHNCSGLVKFVRLPLFSSSILFCLPCRSFVGSSVVPKKAAKQDPKRWGQINSMGTQGIHILHSPGGAKHQSELDSMGTQGIHILHSPGGTKHPSELDSMGMKGDQVSLQATGDALENAAPASKQLRHSRDPKHMPPQVTHLPAVAHKADI